MRICINKNVVFVPGAYNGAIYDLNRNKIYSINHDANIFLLQYINGELPQNDEEADFINELKNHNLMQDCKDFAEYNQAFLKENKLNFVWLEITPVCNLKCIHCYEGESHQAIDNQIKLADWKRIISELAELNCPNIQFIGGEPSCYSQINELIDYAGSFKFNSIGFFTNATLINDAMIDCFLRNGVKINVSIYGHNNVIHDRITQINGSFDITVKNIKKMIRKGLKVNAAVTIMRENERYYEKIIAFIKSLGMSIHKIDLVREVSGCKQNCLLPQREDLIRKKYKTKPNFTINTMTFDNAYYQNTCWYGKFAITASGEVIPCVFERDISYGNLKNISIHELLNSPIISNYWFLDFSKIEECRECEYRYACKDCRPLGKVAGSIYKKSIRCLYHPLTGKWDN